MGGGDFKVILIAILNPRASFLKVTNGMFGVIYYNCSVSIDLHRFIMSNIHLCIYAYICVYIHICAHTYIHIWT